MKATKVLQIAWIGLTRNKLRSLLSHIFGVIIGVATVIVMVSISRRRGSGSEEINSLGANLLFVSMGFGPGRALKKITTPILTLDDAYEIRDGVNGVAGYPRSGPLQKLFGLGVWFLKMHPW